jgi:hypothetical protein
LGTVCWGRENATQDNIRPFEGNWTCYGNAEVEYFVDEGDAERISFQEGDYAISETFNVGIMKVDIFPNYYAGPGDSFTISYKTGYTIESCEESDWILHEGPFESLGYVKVKVQK